MLPTGVARHRDQRLAARENNGPTSAGNATVGRTLANPAKEIFTFADSRN
jgi:hypothetical protein